MRQDVIIEGAFTTSYKTHRRGKNLKNHSPYEHYGKMGHRSRRRRRRNGDKIRVEGKGTVFIKIGSGKKAVSNVLYVPDIDQNMLRIHQLVEKRYKVSFEDKYCFINDGAGKEVLNIKMRGKHFLFDLMEDVSVEHENDHRLKN